MEDTIEEEAITLIEMFYYTDNVPEEVTAKNCALLCVDILIDHCEDKEHWEKVKSEIEKYEPTRC